MTSAVSTVEEMELPVREGTVGRTVGAEPFSLSAGAVRPPGSFEDWKEISGTL